VKRSNVPTYPEIVGDLLLLALVSAVVGWMCGLVMPAMAARFMQGLFAGGSGLSLSAMWMRRVLRPSGDDEEER
jgi:hypothetical protein